MNIRGITKFTLVDYPGKVACIVFMGGCNFCCPYCQNPFLVIDPESQPLITEEKFFNFLDKRIGKLDAVVVSGGEPTLDDGLVEFSKKVKERGFLVKIDTNGSNLKIMKQLYDEGCLDFIGLDYKAPMEKYDNLLKTDNPDTIKKIKQTIKASILFIVNQKITYEIRTTVHKMLLSKDDLIKMRNELNEFGIREWVLQQFNPTEGLDNALLGIGTYTDEELVEIARHLPNTKVRGLKERDNETN